jgi:glutamyl-Q tRNA(Asp) synthetase
MRLRKTSPARYQGRFAPSPTGKLHLGSLVAALASWLCARHQRGGWRVRLEDIDPPRAVAGAADAILTALDRLGLTADAPPLYQSQRGQAYANALQRLCDDGHAFPCWCTRGDIRASHALHRDARCVARPRDDRPPAWRLCVPDAVIEFPDRAQGPQRQNVRDEVGDFVLRRADGLWNYQLACVVDDAFQGITEVVRGCDLLDSTARQILLQRLLGLPTPSYLHIPLALDDAGRKLAKSNGAAPVAIGNGHRQLTRALRFLGQAVPATADTATMLELAARDFDLAPLRGKCAAAWRAHQAVSAEFLSAHARQAQVSEPITRTDAFQRLLRSRARS